METKVAINKRRSIRKYKDISVDENVVLDILNCGRLAPSAKNRQPWRFVAISDKTFIHKIADTIIKNFSEEDELISKQLLNANPSVISTANIIKKAPILILIYKEIHSYWEISDSLSIGACIQNMCLRACELKLGTLWIRDTFYSNNEILKLAGIDSDKFELSSALLIGVADEEPSARDRKPLSEIVKWIK